MPAHESIAARPKSGPNAKPFEEIDPELRWAIWDSDSGAKLWQAAELVHDFVPALKLNAATSNALRQGLLDTSPVLLLLLFQAPQVNQQSHLLPILMRGQIVLH